MRRWSKQRRQRKQLRKRSQMHRRVVRAIDQEAPGRKAISDNSRGGKNGAARDIAEDGAVQRGGVDG